MLLKYFNFNDYRLNPCELKAFFKKNNRKTVVAFQARNPVHKAHFQLTLNSAPKASKDKNAKILLHPVVGDPQSGDIEAH